MAHKTKAQKLRSRRDITTWYPRGSDLTLPDVPANEQAEVRKILSWLGKLPVRVGACWGIAQAVVVMAQDLRVQYVEGAYWNVRDIGAGHVGPMFQHSDDTLECTSVCVCKPSPHAWNTVNGYVVDLLSEFHNWRFGSQWLHEPLKIYSLDDMRAFEEQHRTNPLLRVGGVHGGNFSLYNEVWREQNNAGLDVIAPHLLSKPEGMPDVEYK